MVALIGDVASSRRAGQGNLSAAAPAGVAVVLFVAGVAIGTLAAELAARRHLRTIAAVVLTIADHSLGGFYVLAALAILSMGMQTPHYDKSAGAP